MGDVKAKQPKRPVTAYDVMMWGDKILQKLIA